jgi:DNA-binding response OmpR family regulator
LTLLGDGDRLVLDACAINGSGSPFVPAKILVVEDDPDAREMLVLVLEAEGFTAISAYDGQSGFEVAVNERPDLILTDVEMPDLDGIQMLRLLRRNPETSKLPVLVLTAYGSESMSEAAEAGASGSVQKPVHLASLIGLIRRTLGEASPASLLAWAWLGLYLG